MGAPTASPSPPKSNKADKGKRSRILPTDRIAGTKHLDILRAYAAVSGQAGKSVTNAEVGDIVKMAGSTVTYSNAFFADIGLLQRADDGFTPSPEVTSFAYAYKWNPEKAPLKLAPVFERSWFFQALLPKLQFASLTEKEAIEVLGEAAGAGPEKKAQVALLLTYLATVGLIVQENGTVSLATRQASAADSDEKPSASADRNEAEPGPSKLSNVATSFTTSPSEGVVQFQIGVRVDMSEFAGWEAERIKAFFGGIAQVLAAKGKMEESANPK